MKKIGVLYICTGAYQVFWKDFYESFEKYFLKNSEVHYFIFSDADEIYGNGSNKRIHFNKIEAKPWPLVTLLRFHTFLSIKTELEDFDFLVFFNANMKCCMNISEDDFLPNIQQNEMLVVTQHPGYINSKKCYFPYERNKKSTAFIPYNKGRVYVIGAVNGGKTECFLAMCESLKTNIEIDLKKNYIPVWHDESQLNWYLQERCDYKLLSPSYCYPVGFDIAVEKKITGVSKSDKFDVASFKGVNISKKNVLTKLLKFLQQKMIPYFSSI